MAAAPAPVSSAPGGPGLPEMGSKLAYIVQKGDTLAKIATKIYGDASKWSEIQSFSSLSNPKLIYPGDVVYYQLTEQSKAFASGYESVARSEVEVQQGDTLSTIASRVLGSASNWKLIWRHNDNIENPDRLTAGTKLYYIAPGALSAAVDDFRTQLAESKKEVVRVMAKTATHKADNAHISFTKNPSSVGEDINSVDNEIESDFVSYELISAAPFVPSV
jgi:LysM repeat protein